MLDDLPKLHYSWPENKSYRKSYVDAGINWQRIGLAVGLFAAAIAVTVTVIVVGIVLTLRFFAVGLIALFCYIIADLITECYLSPRESEKVGSHPMKGYQPFAEHTEGGSDICAYCLNSLALVPPDAEPSAIVPKEAVLPPENFIGKVKVSAPYETDSKS